mmetsp:Transcript_10392/g.17422  ORF Transcript_10392/g.17422 Transcript_10392/m.17422 type:complete len:473 (-) Transcript_10392:172-1590(-)
MSLSLYLCELLLFGSILVAPINMLNLAPRSAKLVSSRARFCTHMAILSSSGQSFYESIGSPKFISAPMVDQSSLPWRMFVRQHGTDLAFSQMMHARNFMIDPKYRHDCIDWDDYTHIDGSVELERQGRQWDQPLIAQLAGDDAETLVKAGRYIHHDVAAIDLNLGCPQKIAKRGHYGAYLLPDHDLVIHLLSAMVKELECPITAKIRKLENEEDTIRLCQDIEAAGVSMITVHGRLVTASKLFTGPADWDIIRKVKQSVSIPVVANGGIGCYADAARCLEYTGADAVMSSEGLLENPKLFSPEGDRLFREDFCRAQLRTAAEFVALVKAYPLPRPINQVIRGHLFKMLYRFISAEKNKDLQRQLAEGRFEEMCEVVDLLERRLARLDFDTPTAEQQGYCLAHTYYMRHRNEQAQQRILSMPKLHKSRLKYQGAISRVDDNTTMSDDDLKIAQQQKLSDLKQRLLAKRELKRQ